MDSVKNITKQLDPNGANLPSIKELKGNTDLNHEPQRKASSEGNFYQDLGKKSALE